MKKLMTIALLMFSSSLFAYTTTADYGAVTIKNNNCTKLGSNSVKVHLWSTTSGCGNKWVTIGKGSSVNVGIQSYVINTFGDELKNHTCFYKHEAEGTTGGKQNLNGSSTYNTVTCNKDWAGVCQCN